MLDGAIQFIPVKSVVLITILILEIKMGLVYLACPYSNDDQEITKFNVRIFCEIDALLISQGHFTISPVLKHFIIQGRNIPGTWDYWKEYSYELLSKCTIIYVICLPGWETSAGVKAEIEYCQKRGMPIVYLNPDDYIEKKVH
jgi:hypothetical protein